MSVLLIVTVLYVASFYIVRSQNIHPCESDGCYWEVVNFPEEPYRTIYYPLIGLDRQFTRVRYSGEER